MFVNDRWGLHPNLHLFTRVRMDKHTIDVGNKEVNLTPGMNVSVEIKTGKRRVIEYVLTPLLNGIKEAGRER